MSVKFEVGEVSLNTVLIAAAVIGVIFIGYKVKNAVSDATGAISNWWTGVDLNPFDAGSALTNLYDEFTGTVDSLINTPSGQTLALAFQAAGKDMSKYRIWQGARGSSPPGNAIYIRDGKTGAYYVPK